MNQNSFSARGAFLRTRGKQDAQDGEDGAGIGTCTTLLVKGLTTGGSSRYGKRATSAVRASAPSSLSTVVTAR